jgi:PST family polysaccharide transporter
MKLAPSVLRGTTWTAASQISRQAVQLAFTILLARILMPEDFGLVAMATAVTAFITIFGDLGTSAAVFQKPEQSHEFLSTIFWLNVGFGGFVMVGIVLLAPLIAGFYREPALTAVLAALSISFPLSGLVILQKTLLEKSMRFDVLARIEISSTVIGSGAGIVLAYSGAGVWSLVLQTLMTALAMTVLIWVRAEWRPASVVRVADMKSIASFSANLTGFNVVNYFARNADYILIGRFLGSQNLGYYTLAYRILMFPLQNLSSVIARVMLPVFSRIKNEDARFRLAYLRSIGAIALIAFPLMTFLFVLAEPIVRHAFGEQWLPVVPLLLIFAPVGLVQSIGSTVGPIYIAKERTGLLFRWGLSAGLLLILSFVIGLRWGVVGVASCYAIVSLVLAYPGMSIPLRLISLTVKDCLKVLWRPFACAMIMALLLWAIAGPISSVLTGWKFLAVQTLLGALAYLISSLVLNKIQLQTFWGFVQQDRTQS